MGVTERGLGNCVMGTEFVLKDETVLEMDGSDGCTTM
jgi:hypothetical protein